MSSTIAEVAQAVTDLLNAEFSGDFTAERRYLPDVNLPDVPAAAADPPLVTVVPRADDVTVLTRREQQEEIQIDIAVRKRLPEGVKPESDAARTIIDGLIELCRDIALSFQPGEIGSGTDAEWLGTKIDPVFDRDSLRDNRVFFCVITATYRVAA